MTIRELRQGKTLSKKATKTLKAAHALLSKVLSTADPDDLAEPFVGGPQGDKSMPNPSGQGLLDATGSRIAGGPAGATVRITGQTVEVR